MLNKIGKLLLIISLVVLSTIIAISIWFENVFETIPESLSIPILLFTILCFCLSFSFIYYNSVVKKSKKAIRNISLICSIILFFGVFSKIMHWAGAAAETIIGIFLFSFGCLPLIIKSRYEKRKSIISKTALRLSIVDLFAILFLCLGALFKFMHWPGWLFLTISGCILFVVSIIGWNVSFRKEVNLRQEAEEKLKLTLKALEEKNLFIEEKQKEILDSIRYAKRIQQAMLPSEKFIQRNLNNKKL